jgi:hypothetical protein
VIPLAHSGTEEITYVFLPAAIFFVVFRLVRGKPDQPERSKNDETAGKRASP